MNLCFSQPYFLEFYDQEHLTKGLDESPEILVFGFWEQSKWPVNFLNSTHGQSETSEKEFGSFPLSHDDIQCFIISCLCSAFSYYLDPKIHLIKGLSFLASG